MAFEDFPRWTNASVAKHLLAEATTDSIELLVEFANMPRTPAWENAASNVEITIDGPRFFPRGRRGYMVEVDLFAIISTIDNNTTAANDHFVVIGHVASWMNRCIEVFNLGNEAGDDGLTKIGTLKPDNVTDGIVPTNLKPTRTDDRLHSTISGSYKARYTD